ncbi:unnamed protein product [Trifolium pratense]|uniref:Uncharacterized protein n=1 Tax=Trifolium pratense TaxID=57577 RepID=A0ACB0I6G2_TRIPR|nr:unnamed protein product [Trifolium pratense]
MFEHVQIRCFVFKNLWKSPAPSKVITFLWQLILDRIQTKDNLRKRRMIHDNNFNCVLCTVCVESACHVFSIASVQLRYGMRLQGGQDCF